ncbi:hyaluronate lyase N-terminal domain-containing protein [Pseudarthrobacter polychromogenes]|uniref:Major tropism determinant N-terminal domain-containing protein n=1 Tax=Pseudarthrobacter polychromogenes TaxID=1676 RepID=A0ABQ1XBR5_9MICC|nr:hypothetical protein [Pseudarthrobacter polychromogenes]GGG83507.1 hypothetical protein GCM10011577_01160 [Pseudarthrobacter polychromogenes]
MAQRIQLRRGTAEEWAGANPVLGLGEPGVESDTGKMKLGDGVTAWNGRPYASQGEPGVQGPPGVADDASVAQQVTSGPETIAALSATYGTVLVYSGGAYPARPAGAVAVTYIGPVQPTTWLANDIWKDNS